MDVEGRGREKEREREEEIKEIQERTQTKKNNELINPLPLTI